MKKHLFLVGLAVCAISIISSCNKGGPSKEYASDEQKDKLETTTKTLVSEMDVDKWSGAIEYTKSVTNYVSSLEENYPGSMDAVYDWMDENESDVVALSQMKGGVFEEVNHKLVFTSNGKSQLELIVYPSGKKASIVMSYGPDGPKYQLPEKEVRATSPSSTYVQLPSWIKVEVKEGDKTRLSCNTEISVVDKDKNGILDSEKDEITVSGTFILDDYTLTVSKMNMNASSNASVSFVLNKGSKMLMDISYVAKGGTLGDPTSVTLNADFMGSVQIKGDIDSPNFSAAMEDCEDSETEQELKIAVQRLNKTFNLGLYYDGGNNRQATLSFDVFQETDMTGEWYYSPVFTFGDGSSQTWDEFMDNEQMRSAVNAISNWMDEVLDYFGLD